MSEGAFRFWCKWLLVTSGAMAVFGVVLVVLDTQTLPGMTHALSRHFFHRDEFPDDVMRYHRFVHAVLGGVTSAWGITLVLVVRNAFTLRQPWAWRAVAFAVAAWFVLDSGSSMLAGVWPNVALNVASVLPFAVALAATRRAFVQAS